MGAPRVRRRRARGRRGGRRVASAGAPAPAARGGGWRAGTAPARCGVKPGGSAVAPCGVSATSASSTARPAVVIAIGVRGCASSAWDAQAQAAQRAAADRLLEVAVGDRGDDHGRGRLRRDQDPAREVHVDSRTREDEDRPVPQVHPVAALAQPARNGAAEQAAEGARRVRDRREQHRRAEREQQEATVVEPFVVVVDRDEHVHHARERRHAGELERAPARARSCTRAAPRASTRTRAARRRAAAQRACRCRRRRARGRGRARTAPTSAPSSRPPRAPPAPAA